LDTNVISEVMKPRPDPRVRQFLRDASDPWLCTITLHELVFGAERSPDPVRRAKLLEWIARMTGEFAVRTIVVDNEVAERSGRLRALAAAQGHTTSVVDAVIAAAGQIRGLTIATRNIRDFRAFGVALLDPWKEP
jgi:predicted nucleic acid-binding protein